MVKSEAATHNLGKTGSFCTQILFLKIPLDLFSRLWIWEEAVQNNSRSRVGLKPETTVLFYWAKFSVLPREAFSMSDVLNVSSKHKQELQILLIF